MPKLIEFTPEQFTAADRAFARYRVREASSGLSNEACLSAICMEYTSAHGYAGTGASMAEVSTGLPSLPTGDKAPFQQMAFNLHDTQAEQVKAALNVANHLGPYVDSPNENRNGNALARVCEIFLLQNGSDGDAQKDGDGIS